MLNIRYFDESGFTLTPSIPYGWQPIGETIGIPCQHSKRQNVLGFMSRDGQLHYEVTEQRVTTEVVIKVFDDFAKAYYEDEYQKMGKLCFVILDNASMHSSKAFKKSIGKWLLKGLVINYIPPYSPELNLIEILWRKVKYEWLPLEAYKDKISLSYWLNKILYGFGEECTITFE